MAYYRVGRYREAVETLRADLEGQEDRYLAWDLCFLAMSYHRLGEADRRRVPQPGPPMVARPEGPLRRELHELSAVREEMEATLAK